MLSWTCREELILVPLLLVATANIAVVFRAAGWRQVVQRGFLLSGTFGRLGDIVCCLQLQRLLWSWICGLTTGVERGDEFKSLGSIAQEVFEMIGSFLLRKTRAVV